MKRRPDGTYEVSVYNFCKVSSYHSCKNGHMSLKYFISRFFSILLALIPFAGFLKNPRGALDVVTFQSIPSVWCILYLITITFTSVRFVKYVFSFIFVTFDDIRRKNYGIQLLHNMIYLKNVSGGVFSYDYLEEDNKKNVQLYKDRHDLSDLLRSQEGDHSSSFYSPRQFHSSRDMVVDNEIIPNLEESIHILESEDAVVLPLSFKYQENLIAWVWSRLIMLKLGE
jgi:hypothetical protein